MMNTAWQRIAIVGPTQSGKTLLGSILPVMYHLFEVRENVIFGVPDMDMAADKWREDLLPAIERSRYRDELPRMGGGSKGGKVRAIQFRNGATLRFISGGGGDKSRAGFTSRVLVVTEVDGMDAAGGGSREADKITQLEARLRAFGSRKRVYLECTASIEKGRIWVEYTKGTESRIACRCQHCGAFVSLERPDLQGWRDAENEIGARKTAEFHCSSCGEAWTEDDRRLSNEQAMLIHRGQTTEQGVVEGPTPATETLGFRWSAVNNLLRSAGDTGVDEFRAAHAIDEDNAAKEMCQFVWAVPYRSAALETLELDPDAVSRRMVKAWPRAVLPEDTEILTLGADIGLRVLHWSLHAWRPGATGHTANYGIIEINSDELGFERALVIALAELQEMVEAGWSTTAGEVMKPDQVWIDSNYEKSTDIVIDFCKRAGQRYRACKGYGTGKQRKLYTPPKDKNKTIRFIGDGYHVVKIHDRAAFVFEVDADQWKSWLHARLATPLVAIVDGREVPQPGAMTLFMGTRTEHTKYIKHLTAEHPEEEFVPGKGTVRRWVQDRKQNHWLDTGYLACAAANLMGAALLPREASRPAPAAEPKQPLTTPDGRPYLVTER